MTEDERAPAPSMDEILDDLAGYVQYRIDEESDEEDSVSRAVMERLSRPADAFVRQAPAVEPQPQSLPPAAPARESLLATIAREVDACTQCPLHASRTRTVPGQGNACPELVFVGEGPGAEEDKAGLAFVGRAGQLLTRMIEAMGYTREEVFICNVVKCRPPGNRVPEAAEMTACLPYLRRQLQILAPKVIVALGATALKGLVELPAGMGITKVRGSWLRFEGVDLMPTFHPAYMLRNPNMKKYVWEDLKTVLRHLGRPIPAVRKD